jgi:exodeoxyribonuclease-1
MDGKPSLKLDLISRENRFVTSGRAHEAMSDVEALVQLSRIYFQNLKTWNYCLDFFDKTRDDDRIRNIPAAITIQKRPFRCCILASSAFGPAVNYMAPVIHIGQSRAYRNQSLWLRLDTDEISRIISDTDPTETFVIRKRSGDGLIVLPGLDRFWKRMAEKSQQSAVENLEMLTAHPEKFFAYIEYHTSYTYPVIPDLDPDAGLYQEGFFSQPEKIFIADFHAATVHQKPEILARAPGTRMQTLASRILARNFPDMISPKIQMPHQRYMERLRSADEKDRILGYRNDTKRTQNHALQELSELEQTMVNPDPAQKELLKGLRHYIETL